ncbi:MAG: hypothetical protein IT372_13030 [Polyangiaceae bacterium]|nr:hypothetical protein [Polyangiaceae bacterium]
MAPRRTPATGADPAQGAAQPDAAALVDSVVCSICGDPCEYVHWKIHIPSPKRAKEWMDFWAAYRREKQLIKRFVDDPSIKEITLELLNQKWVR